MLSTRHDFIIEEGAFFLLYHEDFCELRGEWCVISHKNDAKN